MKTLTQITDDTELAEELEDLVECQEEAPASPTAVKAPEYSIAAFSNETAIPVETIQQ